MRVLHEMAVNIIGATGPIRKLCIAAQKS